MLACDDFWELESEDSLLSRNEMFLINSREQNDKLIARAHTWYEYVMKRSNNDIPDYVEEDIKDVPEGISRIIYLDVFRTLKSEKYQKPLIKLLTKCWHDFGDYAQPMCLVAGFLRLTLSENQVYKMLHVLNNEDFYIPGYWKAQATGYATDTYSAMEVAKIVNPTVYNLIYSKQPFPETFCQKFFTAIGIHVFPFEVEFDVMENFLLRGRVYLVQLICAVFDVQAENFISANAIDKIFALLRLDKDVVSKDTMKKIVAASINYSEVENFDIIGMRQEMYDLHLKKRLERVPSEDDSDDIITFSDETSDEE
ncbi:TBC domain containing protein [Entamoeba marina]